MDSKPGTGIDRILACIADSPHAPVVLDGALWLARALEADLSFINVGEDSPGARERLRARLLEPAGVAELPLRIRPGQPDQVICDAAREAGADLIFAGALEQEGVYRDLFGSVARRVARRAPCSVLLSVGQRPGATLGRRVVALLDQDDASRGMLRAVAALARAAGGGALHAVRETPLHASQLRALAHAGEHAARETALAQAASEREALGLMLDGVDLGGVTVVRECFGGRRGAETLRYAADVDAGLLALPAPGRPLGWWHRFFSHPAEVALQRLPCPVLLYRHVKRKS